MRKLGKKRAAVELRAAVPAFGQVITLVAVPKAMELYEVNFSQQTRLHHALDPLAGGRVAVLHHWKKLFAGRLRLLEEQLYLSAPQSDGLLYHHMQAMRKSLLGLGHVQAIWGGYGEHIGCGSV